MVGIHSAAEQIGQRYRLVTREAIDSGQWGYSRKSCLATANGALPESDYGEYIDALDAQQGGRWRRFTPNPGTISRESRRFPSIEDWVAHVAHAAAIGGPKAWRSA